MSGLLTKEFISIMKQKRTFLLLLALFVVFFFTMSVKSHPSAEWATMVALVGVILTVMLTINAFAYDETAKWDGYVRSMPVSILQIVGAKYLLSVVLSIGSTLLVAIVYLVLCGGHADSQTLAFLIAGAACIPLVFCSILMPLFYKLGLQKARIALVIIFLLPTILSNLIDKAGLTVSTSQWILLLKLSPVIMLVLLAASFSLSYVFYKGREI